MDGYALLTRWVAEFALADWGQNIPAEKYNEEELQRINGVHPSKKLPGREYIKVVE